MFTGLVQQVGQIRRKETKSRGRILDIGCAFVQIEPGESIAVNGVCLTVVRTTDGGFVADLSSETASRTSLGAIGTGSRVNLERALRLSDRMGGHWVSGHVDGLGVVVSVERATDAWQLSLKYPSELAPYIAAKGSVALDGVSLTVNRVAGEILDVMIVPHTWSNTILDSVRVGAELNLEVDIVARYVTRFLQVGASDGRAAGSNDERLRAVLERAGLL